MLLDIPPTHRNGIRNDGEQETNPKSSGQMKDK
jgi:hypothetical protein